jgi:putative hydrolase of the HAD superfamily
MKKYAHIIFDLDHTLWDFTANSNATLKVLHARHNLKESNIMLEDFMSHYQEVNDQMWYDYSRGRITKEDIRSRRFKIAFSRVGLVNDKLADLVNEEYLELCPATGYLIPYALEVLNYLKGRYQLHILTNGFSEIQGIKMQTSGLMPYFQEVVNSDISGFLKPDKRIFDYTLNKIQADCHDCVMIGDDLHADVLGARNAGMDHIYFNRRKSLHSESVTHEIGCLSELLKIL